MNLYHGIDLRLYRICRDQYPCPVLLWCDFYVMQLDIAKNKFSDSTSTETNE
jgi:hypothetical protein